jgi:hypothetical protein
VSVGRVRRDACRWPDPDARSHPTLSLSHAPCVGLGCLVRLRFALHSLAVWPVCAIAPSFVSGWRAFSSVSLCKYIPKAVVKGAGGAGVSGSGREAGAWQGLGERRGRTGALPDWWAQRHWYVTGVGLVQLGQ